MPTLPTTDYMLNVCNYAIMIPTIEIYTVERVFFRTHFIFAFFGI